MIEQLVPAIQKVSQTAKQSLAEIRRVTTMMQTLSINALIEAARAGERGSGFAVVAQEVSRVSETIAVIANGLGKELTQQLSEVDRLSKEFGTTMRGLRLAEFR